MADQNIKVNINLDLTEFNKNAKAMSDALSKVLGRDVKMFSDEMNKAETSINGVQKALGNAGKTASVTGSAVKQSNIQWNNLSLLIQDLPFGFRGIQNNLPALGQSIAGFAGPAMFAFSALIAAITAYDLGIFGATSKTNDFKKALKETNDEIRNTVNYTNSEVSNLKGLVDVMLDVNTTESIRNKALKEAKEAITQVDEAQGKKIKTIGDAIVAINLYTEAIQQQQMQEVIGKRIAEITIGQIEKRNNLAIETAKASKGFHPIDLFMGNTALQGLQTEIIANETLLRQLEDYRKSNTKALLLNPFSSFNKKGPSGNAEKDAQAAIEQQQRVNEQVIQNLIDAKKQEIKIVEDDAFAKYEASKQLAELEKKLALEKLYNAGYTAKQIAAIEVGIYQERDNKLVLLGEALQVQLLEQDVKTAKARKKIKDLENKEALYFTEQRIKAVQTEADASIRANRGNYQAQKQALEEAIVKLAVFRMAGIGGAEGILKLNEALTNTKAKLDGLVDPMEAFNNSLTTILRTTLENLAVALGEGLGKMLAGGGGIKELMNNFLGILAEGLIQVGKLAISTGLAIIGIKAALESLNPVAAIAAGIALVALGTYVKSRLSDQATAFANGGIVSGPTLGLMGEYPGAASNPEVIAPLDKLKSLIGGSGGGTLEARISGNDLLILMNKAGRNNNNTF
jgi:GR25 family glycosyltransferase involved in LPS biosynthesis